MKRGAATETATRGAAATGIAAAAVETGIAGEAMAAAATAAGETTIAATADADAIDAHLRQRRSLAKQSISQGRSSMRPGFKKALWGRSAARFPGEEKRFNLLRWFSVLSLIAIISVVGGATLMMTKYLTRSLLLRDAIVSRDFLEGVLTLDVGPEFFRRPAEQRDMSMLTNFTRHMDSVTGLIAADIYDANRVVVWSSDAQMNGRRLESADQLQRALRGYVVVEWGPEVAAEHLQFRTFDDQLNIDHFVRVYLPIRGKTADDIFAVVELVSTPHGLFDAIDDGVWLIQSSAGAVGVVLYLAFFWIILRADRTLQRQQERLREGEALATVGEMSAAVAHSIRNPLASIRSAAELAREDAEGDVVECLDDIIHESDRVNKWVSELLMATRGTVEFTEVIDLNEIIRDALDGRALEAARNKIAVQFDPQPLPLISGSRALLSHAMLNVLANAQEAMEGGGNLRIASRLDANGAIKVVIEDSGAGISDDLTHRIFQPMFTTKPNGLGLGLALTRRIVERHAGQIVIGNGVTQGATVELTFPVRG